MTPEEVKRMEFLLDKLFSSNLTEQESEELNTLLEMEEKQ